MAVKENEYRDRAIRITRAFPGVTEGQVMPIGRDRGCVTAPRGEQLVRTGFAERVAAEAPVRRSAKRATRSVR